jgi:hypothetical protein
MWRLVAGRLVVVRSVIGIQSLSAAARSLYRFTPAGRDDLRMARPRASKQNTAVYVGCPKTTVPVAVAIVP